MSHELPTGKGARAALLSSIPFLLLVLMLAGPSVLRAQDEAASDPTPEDASSAAGDDLIQLSFEGVDVGFLVKWLAEFTGKSIVKHKEVQCQLTILSPERLPRAEALRLVYRALELEGFSVVETDTVLMILPVAKARELRPEIVNGQDELRGSRIVVKLVQLEHVTPDSIQSRLKAVLSGGAKVDIDAEAGTILITDTADNVALADELIEQLDQDNSSASSTEVVPLEHAKAEQLVPILEAVFARNAGAAPQQKPNPKQPKPPQAPAGGIKIKFIADTVSNRIVITAPPTRMDEIKDLIQTLDQEKPADVRVRVIDLEHVDAAELVREISPMYQKLRGQAFKDSIEISAHSRSNKLIVLSGSSNFEAIEKLVQSLDVPHGKNQEMRTVVLEHADAEEITEHMTQLFEDSDTGRDSYYYYRYAYDSDSAKDKVRFVADRRRNAVIIIGPKGTLDQVEEMVKALDDPVQTSSLIPRIFRLQYVSAFDVEELLDELFQKKTRERSYYYYDQPREYEDRDIGKLYGKVRVTSEFYTNSLIVSANSEEAFKAVKDIIDQLDQPTKTGDTTRMVRLRYAKSVTLANNLNIIFAQAGAPPRQGRNQRNQQNNNNRPQNNNAVAGGTTSFELEEEVQENEYFPWLGSAQQGGGRGTRGTQLQRPVSDLVGKVRVVPDARTNSLLISCNAHLIPEILQVVEQLDVPTAQVMIEATIVEVSSDFRDRLGIRWSPNGDAIFNQEDLDMSFLGSGSANYSEVFAGSALQDAVRTGILDSGARIDLLVQFLSKETGAKVKAEPRINVADNERGKLFIGSRVPFISGSLSTPEGGRSDSFDYIDVGIILEVTPHINDDGEVALRVRVESSQIRPGETLFGGAIIDTRNYRTDLTIQDRETLILGGIIQKESSEVERKVPLLGDIPLLGYLFKKVEAVEREVELMVFLKPRITRTPAEVRKLLEQERTRTPRIEAWNRLLEEQRLEAVDPED